MTNDDRFISLNLKVSNFRLLSHRKSSPLCKCANQSQSYKFDIVFNVLYHQVQLSLATYIESDALLSKRIVGIRLILQISKLV